jgi:hemoglobin
MKKDIQNRDDIIKLVNAFYDSVKSDKVIGYIFTDVVRMNWEKHLPLMYDFWDNILFYTENYDGNPMLLHEHLSQVTALNKKHFRRWNKLFSGLVDEMFSGKKADLIKQKSLSISAILQQSIFTGNR